MDRITALFSQRLEALEIDCFRVLEELSKATALLRDDGRPIADSVLANINYLGEQIAELCNELRLHFEQISPESAPLTNEPSLKEARALLKRISRTEASVERTRAAAVAVLDRALLIAHRDNTNFEPLVACLQRAAVLRAEILKVDLPKLHPAVQSLAQDKHPFAALVMLVSSQRDLDDETYDQMYDLVENSFGRALKIQVQRERLAFQQATALKAEAADDHPIEKSEDTQAIILAEAADDHPIEVSEDTGAVVLAETASPQQSAILPNVEDKEVFEPTQSSNLTQVDEIVPTANGHVVEEEASAVAFEPDMYKDSANLPAAQPVTSPSLDLQRINIDRDELPAAPKEYVPQSTIVPEPILESEPFNERSESSSQEGATSLSQPFDDTDAPLTEPIYATANESPQPIEASPARQFALQLLGSNTATQLDALPELMVKLLQEEQTAFAYHIASIIDQASPEDMAHIPAWLAKALVLAPHVRSAKSEIADQLTLCFADYDADYIALSPEPWPKVLSLLLMSMLPAALIAPETGLPSLLQILPEEGMPEHCREFCQTIVSFGLEAQPLDPQVIRLLENHLEWKQAMEALQEDAAGFWAEYEHKELVYDPATDVWQNWTSPGRFIHRMITPILEDDTHFLKNALDATEDLRTPQAVKREMEHTDRQVLGRSFGPDIRERALEHIRIYSRHAIDLVRRWEKLNQTRPSAAHSDLMERVKQLRTQVFSIRESVLEELREIGTTTHLPIVRCAVAWSYSAVERINSLLGEQQIPASDSIAASFLLLNWPLLRATQIALNDQWQPTNPSPDFAKILLGLIETFDGTWESTIDAYHATDNHETTGRIIAYLGVIEPDSQRFIMLRERRLQQLAYVRATLYRTLDRVQRLVDNVVTSGLLREDDVYQANAKIRTLSARIGQNEFLRDTREQIEQMNREFQERLDMQVKRVKEYLIRADIPQDSPIRQRIKQVLDQNDALTANEYISLAEHGDMLPERTLWGETLRQFIGPNFRMLFEALKAEHLLTIAQKLKAIRNERNVYTLGPITFQGGEQATDAHRLVEAWSEAKRLMSRTSPLGGWDIGQIGMAVRNVFDQLGFLSSKVELLSRPSRRLWMTITTAPLKDKDQCPISRYGSEAEGRYRLLVIYDKATEDDIIQEIVDTQKGQPPIIIFYFGLLTSQRRRSLTRLCREKLRTCVLIDDTLAVFLSQYRPPRLSRFFECTLPFTYIDPYITTAGIVPPEMFYGRKREQDQILNPMGSCFIYGGRQIGKTALLRHVENIAHSPRSGQLIRLVDLKDKGIGFDRPIEEIWNVIAAELQPFGVLPNNLPPNTGVERYQEHIENWLGDQDGRQIIMLLDEADQFLDSDGSSAEFLHTSRLKGLMDRTRRRFKIVFAGLHNVQRTTRQENNPLAHYGTPLCIGPLFDDNEWREARALIERPIASLGYIFGSADLATRILSQTNYYPSLLQLYGGEMMRYLTDPNRPLFPAKQNPPHFITLRHIEDVYQRRELRDNIRRRFRLTLELDRRYEVLTYAVADSAMQDEEILLKGLSAAEIREQALRWWALGFERDSSEGMILSLLEELVGLGIFRRVSGNRFTLRNANMLMFVGTQDEVRAELRHKREVPPTYTAAVFRAAYIPDGQRNGVTAVRRSPMTVQQVSELRQSGHGTSIVFGMNAAGLNDLIPYLRQSFGQNLVIELPTNATEETFQQQLQALAQRDLNGVTLLMVPPSVDWRMTWVERAHQRLSRLTSRTAFARAVFIADPQHTWRLLKNEASALEQALSGETRSTVLQPWQDAALHQWLLDCDISPREPEVRERITDATGNWPLLLYEYHQRVHRSLPSWEDRLNTLIDEQKQFGTAAQLAPEFGLTIREPQLVLGMLAEWFEKDPVPSTELITMLDNELPESMIHLSLRWASTLNLISPAGHQQWALSPILQRILGSLKRGKP